jgi:sortase (surface protein transpeptidase)
LPGEPSGISVFYYLKNLHAGDTVYVTLADGTVARFAVDGLQKVAKGRVPDRVRVRQVR